MSLRFYVISSPFMDWYCVFCRFVWLMHLDVLVAFLLVLIVSGFGLGFVVLVWWFLVVVPSCDFGVFWILVGLAVLVWVFRMLGLG